MALLYLLDAEDKTIQIQVVVILLAPVGVKVLNPNRLILNFVAS